MSDQAALKRLSDEMDQLKQIVARQVKARTAESCEVASNTTNAGCTSSPISDADVLPLNVGGTKIDVSRATLVSIPSLLASKFSGEWDSSLPKDSEGRFFIDEEPELFVALVNYLRDYSRMIPLENSESAVAPVFTDKAKQNRFYRMLDAFHLTEHFFPVELWKFDQHGWGMTLAERRFETQVHQGIGDYSYFLQLAGKAGSAKKKIKSFEAQLLADEGASVRIGWHRHDLEFADQDEMIYDNSLTLNIFAQIIEAVKDVVEDDQETVTSTTKVSFENDDNPIIRCADRGAKWFVDDKLVADIALDGIGCDASKMNPIINFKGSGSFRITKVEFEP